MQVDHEIKEKVTDFISEIMLFGKGRSTQFSSLEEIADQALVILSIAEIDVKIDTLKSIEHMLDKTQKNDINTIISQLENVKIKLYGNVKQL